MWLREETRRPGPPEPSHAPGSRTGWLSGILPGMGGYQFCLAGASVGNGNRGVEALGRSVLDVLDAGAPGAGVSVFDDGWGTRPESAGRYQSIDVDHVGVRVSRRWHRPESWAQIKLAQRFERFGNLGNDVASRIARADAILDISGGDSFTDLYGEKRLRSIAAPKEAALRARRPLVLLPQTYGPFGSSEGRQVAERLIRSSALAYARDAASYDQLLELAGAYVPPKQLRNGVDVAFALQSRRPDEAIAAEVEALGDVVAGVNVSGLLRAATAHERFGLAGDYVATMTALVEELIRAGAHVLMVPHVDVPGGQGESDMASISDVRDALPEALRSRITVVPSELDAAELKWCIARCAWFVGSRMHSTIAALSSQVPACGYAYSDKTRGVFETCRAGEHVVDARQVGGEAAVEAMMALFERRVGTKKDLSINVPPLVERARGQLYDIIAEVDSWRDVSPG